MSSSSTSLAQRTTLAAVWSISTSLAARALGLVATLLLTRYIAPDAYGAVTAASVVVLSANQLSTLNVGNYLIAHPRSGRAEAFHATVVHVGLGVIAIGMVVALRDRLGPMFDAPQLGLYVPGLAIAVLADRISQVPERLLVRQLRFKMISLARTAGELAFIALSVGLVLAGSGAMALVAGNVARSFVRAGIVLGAVRWRDWTEPHPLSRGLLVKMIGYGTALSVSVLAVFASRRWDNLVMAGLFGPAVLGLYNLAYNLADVPAVQVGEQVTDVLLASFPQIEPHRRSEALLRVTRILALIMTPLAIGLALMAEPLTALFFIDRWAGVAPFLVVLSAMSVTRPMAAVIGVYLQSRDRLWSLGVLEWLSVGLMLGLMLVLGRFGPLGAAVAVGVAFALRHLLYLRLLARTDGFAITPLLYALVPPLAASAVMTGCVLASRLALRWLGHEVSMATLISDVIVGAAAYVSAALLLARGASRDLLGIAGRFLRRRPDPGRRDPAPDEAAPRGAPTIPRARLNDLRSKR